MVVDSIVGSRLPSLVKILLLLRSSNASPRYSVFLVFRLMFIVTEGQLSSVENWTICTAGESLPVILLLITVPGTLNVNVSNDLENHITYD